MWPCPWKETRLLQMLAIAVSENLLPERSSKPLGIENISIPSLHLFAFLMPIFYKLNHVWISEIPSVSGMSDSAGIGEKSTMFKAVLSRLKCSAARKQAFQKDSLKGLIQVGSTYWSTICIYVHLYWWHFQVWWNLHCKLFVQEGLVLGE